MCYTKEASIGAFLTGLLSSIALILLGNQSLQKENLVIGLFFIYVSFMQLIDYMIYIDPGCKLGSNKLAGYFGPFIYSLQPVLLFILFVFVFGDQSEFYQKYKNIFITINVVYFYIILITYSYYLSQNETCSNVEQGRQKWVWEKNGFGTFNIFYAIVLIVNFFLFFKAGSQINLIYFAVGVGLIFAFYLISKFNYINHVSEFWCFFANSVPLILLIGQKLL